MNRNGIFAVVEHVYVNMTTFNICRCRPIKIVVAQKFYVKIESNKAKNEMFKKMQLKCSLTDLIYLKFIKGILMVYLKGFFL